MTQIYKAALFDLDGTLLDTVEDLTDAINNAFRHFGLPILDVKRVEQLMGSGGHKLLKDALPKDYDSDMTFEDIFSMFRAEYVKNWAVKTHPYTGINELLTVLTEKGLKLAVFSNKNDAFVKAMVAHFFPQFNFKAVLGENPSILLKPAPDGALQIASALRIQPAQFIYLGDSDVDMLTANNTGMFAVGVTWGYRSRQVLHESGASIIIDSPLELLRKVDI